MPEIPFIGGAYLGRSTNVNAQVCQNLFPIADKEGGKSVLSLMGTPGLKSFCVPGPSLEVRGMVVLGVYLYATIGQKVYRIDAGGTATAQGGSLLTYSGPVWMTHNGTQIMIVDGQYGYILESATVTRITDADFPTPRGLAYQDGYFIVPVASSAQFYVSASYDGTAWDATDFATAEAYPDNLVAVVSAKRELWLLGANSYEVWYNSGATFPFDRIAGANNTIGCGAAASAAEREGVVCWLDNNRYVRASSGYDAQKISTSQVDYQIGTYSTVSDAVGFLYSQEGATFYILNFPTAGKTWAYDFSTGLWHTRASGANDGRHRANCYALFDGKHCVGDFSNGTIYTYDFSTFTDNGDTIRRVRAAQTLTNDRKNVFHHSLEVEFEAGVGLEDGSDPQAALQWSDDGGHTWSNERWTSIGKVGEYRNRAVWRRLGCSRERVYKVTVADPVKVVMVGAHLNASPGMS